jgi:plasmid stabilization system protein ParE
MPEIGSPWTAEDPRYQGLRYFPIPRFPNYVVFYRPLAFGAEILHILHGARDIKSILEAQEGEEEQE